MQRRGQVEHSADANPDARPDSGAEAATGVKSARRAIALLEVFAARQSWLSLAQLYEATGFPRSSLHGLLRTLRDAGWIEADETGASHRRGVARGRHRAGNAPAPRWNPLTRRSSRHARSPTARSSPMSDQRLLITGAAGIVGTMMRTRLARPDRVLRLLDITPPDPAAPDERVEIRTGSVTDAAAMTAACRDVDAIIHLGGISREDSWERILEINIDGTHTVLEAARTAGVRRVVLASSNHAVGFRAIGEAGGEGLPGDSSPRPDTYYGVSKAAIEALGSLYHSRFGMDVSCLRIGSCFDRPADVRQLSIWLSPEDCARLLEACLTTAKPGYRVLWGMSANTRGVVSLREGEQIGYRSLEDAERFADQVPPGELPEYLGGAFCDIPLGRHNPL